MSPSTNQPLLTPRHLAMLRAVAAGRGEALCGCEPDLLIDGRFCDHLATHELFHAGLIITAEPGPIGRRVAADITDIGRQALTVA
ncbi:hypothetical protein ACVGVM_19235 [Pseudonocardia bannensis]|uniref:Uncharacterized protein n=1 Tax=Pseudonocardia bannensis TaxID=630973 RepID=A0A848DJF7_9PSEU|nr:hypothetical protein [Pseudonocardia bannensis]NMH92666.1 hypothetical protein [Pseudonocardia bannensis]